MKLVIPKIGETFRFVEDFKTGYNFNFTKGMKFMIKKIKNDQLTIKNASTMGECKKMMEIFKERLVANNKKKIKEFQFCIDLWNEDPNKFFIDKKGVEKGNAHCINTGYHKIPKDHPDVYGMAKPYEKETSDTIMTHDYKHVNGVENVYSYQAGKNEYYSKACYEFMQLGDIKGNYGLEFYETPSKELNKWLYQLINQKLTINISEFEKAEIEKVNRL